MAILTSQFKIPLGQSARRIFSNLSVTRVARKNYSQSAQRISVSPSPPTQPPKVEISADFRRMGRKDKKRKSQILFENDQEKPAQLARPKNTIEREIEEQNKIKNIKFAKKRKTKRELIEENQKEDLLIKKLTNKLGA